jgi:hypothetical protein
MDPNAVTLDELERGVNNAQSLKTLRENLHNMQRRQGGVVQLFTIEYDEPGTTIQSITSRIETIETQVNNGAKYPSISPTISELPDLVEGRVREIVEEHYGVEK